MKVTNTKLVITGSLVEAFSYIDKPLSYGSFVPTHRRAPQKIVVIDKASELRKSESRKRSMRRAGSNIRKLVNANAGQWKSPAGIPYVPVFATLTFEDDIRDGEEANGIFSRFIRRLNYVVAGGSKKCTLKYVAVTEFQDRSRNGVIHFHVIFFNLPSDNPNLLESVWTHGFVHKRSVEESENVGAYVSKSMSPVHDDSRLDACKRYFSSRGLNKPIEIREQSKAQGIIGLIPDEYIQGVDNFDGFQGKVRRTQYRLSKNETLFDVIPELSHLL
jgi:hypothetical protein